jgi:hypothetical protein
MLSHLDAIYTHFDRLEGESQVLATGQTGSDQ